MPTPWAAGVCAGLAVHLGIRVKIVRILFALGVCIVGASIALYLWLWVMVPKDDPYTVRRATQGYGSPLAPVPSDKRRTTVRNQLIMAGLSLIVIAIFLTYFSTNNVLHGAEDLLGGLLIVIGIGLVWSRTGAGFDPRTFAFQATVAAGVLCLLSGIAILFLIGQSPIAAISGAIVGAVLVIALGAALFPLWLRTARELSATRVQQVRDAERAEIAAHLHDSVLQTLTLIRGAANDPARVRSLALAQERELRAWLYTGKQEAAESTAEAIREVVGAVEETHGVPVEVVTVGDMQPGPAELALVAAAGEATNNAVRHGAPPISVYLEISASSVDAYIKDAGPGFDMDSIPSDRHGVRGSIIGRLERAGGTAVYRRLRPGTEVHLKVSRELAATKPTAIPAPQVNGNTSNPQPEIINDIPPGFAPPGGA